MIPEMPRGSPPRSLADPALSDDPAAGGLARRLGAWDLMLLAAGGAIGGGIFLTPATIARQLPDPRWILAAWVTGGVLTIAGGLVYAELAAMFPEAGGTYAYLREAYGPCAAFLYGWIGCFVIETGSMAAVAVGLAEYVGAFLPKIGAHTAAFRIGAFSVSTGQAVAIAAVALLSVTHYRGVREGVRIQGAFTSVILVAMVALSIGGLARGHSIPFAPAARIPIGAFGGAMIAVLWSFYGWNEALTASGEVRNPRKNIPLGLLVAVALVTLLYVGVNVAFLRTMTVAELAGAARPAQLASLRFFGAGATLLISGAIVAMAIGCTSSSVVPAPRIAFAMARDRFLPEALGTVHPRFRTPAFAIVVQAVWTALLCVSGRYDQLYTFATFAVILAYAAAGWAIFVFRRKRPDADRPYRCWGYPIVPLLFVGSSLAVAVATIRAQPRETLAGIAIMLAGLPVYFWMRRRKAASS